MSEFFLELFTEEIPANLQSTARKNLLISFKTFLDEKILNIKITQMYFQLQID